MQIGRQLKANEAIRKKTCAVTFIRLYLCKHRMQRQTAVAKGDMESQWGGGA